MLQNRVRQSRLAHGLTQASLAEKTGLSLGTIVSLEMNRGCRGNLAPNPRYDTMKRLATVLDTEISDLFSETDERPTRPPHARTGGIPHQKQHTQVNA